MDNQSIQNESFELYKRFYGMISKGCSYHTEDRSLEGIENDINFLNCIINHFSNAIFEFRNFLNIFHGM